MASKSDEKKAYKKMRKMAKIRFVDCEAWKFNLKIQKQTSIPKIG